MTPSDIRRKLISNAVDHIRSLGYVAITSENILTEPLYSQYFKRLLEEGEYDSSIKSSIANELIKALPK